MSFRALLLIALAWGFPARADEPQYRQLTLVDGRVLTAEILSTEAQGLLLQMPQGRALVSFELLKDMIPTDLVAYNGQADWMVWVRVPDAYQVQVEAMLDNITGVEGAMVGYGNDITSDVAGKVTECGTDLDCITATSISSPWRWVITGEEDAAGGLNLFARTNTGPPGSTNRATLTKGDDTELWFTLHDLIGLERPAEGPPRIGRGDPGQGQSNDEQRKMIAMSFVPVPGITSLAQGDPGGFGIALGVVVPSTAVWVGAVGNSGQSAAEFGVLSVAGFYAATVITNQVVGMRSLRRGKPTVTVLPGARGGATVSVGARF